MGSLHLWGYSIQEMGSNVVIGCSIYGVVVIHGSLCFDSTVPHLKCCYSSGELPLRAELIHAAKLYQVNLAHMSPIRNRSTVLQHFKHGNAIKICKK